MDIATVDVKVEGIAPIIFHNVNLANPFGEYTQKIKEITAKSKKTTDDLLRLAHLEFEGSLYFDKEMGVYIPSQYFESAIKNAMSMIKRGTGKLVSSGLYANEAKIPLIYDGPTDMAGLWDNGGFHRFDMVSVMRSRILRCRPCFQPPWKAEFSLSIVPGVLDVGNVKDALVRAGHFVGIGDWRPKFGRFNVAKFKIRKGAK